MKVMETVWVIETSLHELFQSAVGFFSSPPPSSYTIYESDYMKQDRDRNVKVCRHAVNTSTHMQFSEMCPLILMFVIGACVGERV